MPGAVAPGPAGAWWAARRGYRPRARRALSPSCVWAQERTSMPARTDSAYAASKHAQAVLKSPAALASLPFCSSMSTFSSRCATAPVNADVGICAVTAAVGTTTGASP
eukprot:1543425-Prymnesium_polylepis.2